MNERTIATTGAQGRRPRRTDAETRGRMMDAAIRRVLTDGLSVGVDQLGFEAVIADAEVARSAVYRRWPHREDFYADMLVELLRREESSIHFFAGTSLDSFVSSVGEDLTWTQTTEGRRAMAVELCRVGAAANYSEVRTSPANRTHRSLSALIECGEPSFRERAQDLLRASEARFTEKMTPFYSALLKSLGMRLRPGITMGRFVSLAASIIEGVVEMSPGFSPALEGSVLCDPFRTGRVAEWTSASLGYTALVLGLVEPDPDYVFSPDAIGALASGLNWRSA